MKKLDELFTITSLLALQGSATAALLVPNVLAYLIGDKFQPYEKWVSFAVAMGLAYLVAVLAESDAWTKWIVAFFNGFLIFATAVGLNEGIGEITDVGRGGFFASWF
jgi:hypothetical protein